MIQNLSDCHTFDGKASFISSNQICAGGNQGRDSCYGDSGGPLQHAITFDNVTKIVQEGLVSYGPLQCGVVNHPAIYTDVRKYIKWILNHLEP